MRPHSAEDLIKRASGGEAYEMENMMALSTGVSNVGNGWVRRWAATLSVAALLAGMGVVAAAPAGATSSSTTYAHHHRPFFVKSANIPPPVTPLSQSDPGLVSSLKTSEKSGAVVGGRTIGVEPHITTATATVFTVNTTNDTPVSPSTGITCSDASGDCSFRAAVEAADNLGLQSPAVPVVINVPAGTYTEGADGEVYIENSAGVTINGAGLSSTNLVGNGSDRVIGIGGPPPDVPGTPVAINGVTVSGGSAPTDSDYSSNCGGGILVNGVNDILELNASTVSGNTSDDEGAGICDNGEMFAENDTFANNTVTTQGGEDDYVVGGGGITVGWDDFGAANLTNDRISGNIVNTNEGTDDYGYGGGINNFWGSALVMSDDTVTGNTVEATSVACSDGNLFCGYLAGGGLGNWYGNAQITGTTFSNNTVLNETQCDNAEDCYVASFGGGVADDWGISVFNDNIVTGNTSSTGPSGNGAMTAAEGGGVASYAPLLISDSTINSNSVVGSANFESSDYCDVSGGGGVFEDSDEGGMVITGSTVANNTITDGTGGGIVFWPEDDDSTGNVLQNDQITGNVSQDTYGGESTNPYPYYMGSAGGVYFETGSINILGSNISGNTATTWGGGLWVDEDSYGSVADSTISDNTAGYLAGGVLLTYEGNVDFTNTTIAANAVTWTGGQVEVPVEDDYYVPGGGGIYLMDGSIVRLSYDTISLNTGQNAGGILYANDDDFSESGDAGGYASITGTIIAGNTTSGSETDCAGVSSTGSPPPSPPVQIMNNTSGGYNLTGDGSCGLGIPTDINNVSAELGPLSYNGGPGDTMIPEPGSPVIDAGGGPPTCPATDERGVKRPQGTACDIGAVEVAAGYYAAGADGAVYAFHEPFFGSAVGLLTSPVVGIAAPPDAGGYWLVTSAGGIAPFGSAGNYGSAASLKLSAPVVGMASTPDGKGYWLVASDGGVFCYGNASFYGSTGGIKLNKPVVAISPTPDGKGYWLVASDGGIFSFGDAGFYGSTGGITLNKPVVDMAATPDGKGYWLVASDGGVFTFGDAHFYGSYPGDSPPLAPLHAPIVGMARTGDGNGYFMVGGDGGAFAFGDGIFQGSLPGLGISVSDISGIAVP
jgi:hypothetical protein